MMGHANKAKRHKPVRPPNYRVAGASEFPPLERSTAWSLVPWPKVKTALNSGQVVEFCIEPHDMIGFWQYAMVMLGRTIAVRYHSRQKGFWIRPFTDAQERGRSDRTPPNQTEHAPVDSPVQGQACRDRLRLAATIRLVVADADAFTESIGYEDQIEADRAFVANRGHGRYPLLFTVSTLQYWRVELVKDGADLRLRYDAPGTQAEQDERPGIGIADTAPTDNNPCAENMEA